MKRPDFEIAILELEAMIEEVNSQRTLAKRVHNQLLDLKEEGYNEFEHLPALTDELLQCFLVALDRVQNGQPKRWFDDSEHPEENE